MYRVNAERSQEKNDRKRAHATMHQSHLRDSNAKKVRVTSQLTLACSPIALQSAARTVQTNASPGCGRDCACESSRSFPRSIIGADFRATHRLSAFNDQ